MADAYYYVDDAGERQGPLPEAEIVRLIQRGTARAETLIWTAGMSDWARADAVPPFSGAFAAAPPPARARAVAGAASSTGALTGAFPAWGLFWRSVVMTLGILFVVPAPWAGVWFYKWFAGNVTLPGGRPLRLAGGVGDAWWLFAGLGVVEWIGPTLDAEFQVAGLGALSSLLAIVFGWALVRWFCAHLETDDGATKIAFRGGVLAYVGWSLLVAIAFVTVIGWAWAFKHFLRWICARIEGAPRFAFKGGGFAILWRTLLLAFGSMLIVTIPWLMRWYANWMVSQFSTETQA